MTEQSVKISPADWVAKQAKLYAETNGGKGGTVQGAPCLLMDYRGRRTGELRRTVLIYGRDGDSYLVVASYGGSDKHPLWYLNLVANPEVELQVGADRFTARAETLSAQDKARVWPSLVEIFKLYEGYQKKTTRDIPVVRLTRVTTG